MKRIKEKEHKIGWFTGMFFCRGYKVIGKDNKTYIYWGKLMADACERAYCMTGETNGDINESLYVRPYDRRPGKQHIRPFWWFGRVYLLEKKRLKA